MIFTSNKLMTLSKISLLGWLENNFSEYLNRKITDGQKIVNELLLLYIFRDTEKLTFRVSPECCNILLLLFW